MCAQLHPSICSSNTVFLSLPQPALPSALSCNPSAYGGQTANSLDSNENVQNWIIKQVRPVAKTSHETSGVPTIFHSAWSDSWAHKLLPIETPVMFHNQTKINKSMQCEVCKIECNSKSVFEKHISGKKHQRNLQLQNNCTDTVLSETSYASSQIQMSGVPGNELFVAVGRELESKKQKLLSGGGASVDSVKVCSICNIACNSQEVLSKHLAGKKHAAKVDLISNKGIGSKKIKVAQPARCEVCNINCNSNDVYIAHLSGKKHMRNLEKLSKSDNDGAGSGSGATAAILTANALQHATNAVTEPQEKPDPSKQEEISSHKPGNAVKMAPEKDFETKKHVGGASAVSVKLCTLCNVVCNSEMLSNSHITGQKLAILTANALQHATNAVTEPQEKPDPSKQEEISSHKPGNAVMLEVPEKDFETKKRKRKRVRGASAASVKLCTLCNVVCNSETVYNSHLTGQKHAAMVKKQAGSTIS